MIRANLLTKRTIPKTADVSPGELEHRGEADILPLQSTTSVGELTLSLVIRDIATSYALSQALSVAATLGLADLVAARPKTASMLAFGAVDKGSPP